MFEHDPARNCYQSACALLISEGLPCPPVHHKFTGKLQQTRYSALFTTEPSLPDPYHFQFYLNHLLSGQCPSMVVFGVSGHGFASRAMHYYLIDKHIAVLFQDGLPEAPEGWVEKQAVDYDLASQLYIACQDAVQAKQLAADEKLVICRSFFLPGQWGIIKQSGEKVKWETATNPLEAAIEWLTGNKV